MICSICVSAELDLSAPAKATLPFHFGSASCAQVPGISASGTSLVLTASTVGMVTENAVQLLLTLYLGLMRAASLTV